MIALARFRRAGLRTLVRGTATFAGAALVLFHLWLFAGRLRDLSIAEPRVLASWLASGALALFALFLRRRGLPLASGRSGLVFWLLVLLLHLGMTPVGSSLPSAELTLGLGLELAVATFGVAALFGLTGRRGPDARRARARALGLAELGFAAERGACDPLASPRPPPFR